MICTDTEEERRKLKDDTDALIEKAKHYEGALNGALGLKAMMTSSAESKIVRKYFASEMRKKIQDDGIFDQLLPDFSVGCRRLTPGNPYMKAIQKENCTLHKTAVTKVTETSVIGANGDEVEVDTLICATGFDVSYVPKYRMVGRNGVSLQDKWDTVPEGYSGLAVPDMPNYFLFQGPAFPIANGSVMGPIQAVGAYIVQIIQKMQREKIHSVEPKQSVTDEFNHHVQTWIQGTCWVEKSCRSWYKHPKTGRVNAIWPGSSLHFCEMIQTPRYEDYNIKYQEKSNMFAFMGLGFTQNQVSEAGDLSPYIAKGVLEKKFYSFKPSASEADVIAHRKSKVNDGPKAVSTK